MMENTYTTVIRLCERTLVDGMITNVYFFIEGVDDTGEYRETVHQSVMLDEADPETMIAYEDVTEEQLQSWVADKVGEEKMQEMRNSLERLIDERKNPTIGKGLPYLEA